MPANGSGYRVARKKKLTHFVLYALTSLMKLRHTKLRRTKVRQFFGATLQIPAKNNSETEGNYYELKEDEKQCRFFKQEKYKSLTTVTKCLREGSNLLKGNTPIY